MKRLIAVCAVVVLMTLGCGKDDVDVNPGKGNDGIGNPAKKGDQGEKGEGDGD
jgi:hypothetical protein